MGPTELKEQNAFEDQPLSYFFSSISLAAVVARSLGGAIQGQQLHLTADCYRVVGLLQRKVEKSQVKKQLKMLTPV